MAQSYRTVLGAATSWLAFGVPIKKEPSQRFNDMWKPGWDLATIEAYDYGEPVPSPNAHCLK